MLNECLEICVFASLISPSKIILFEKWYRTFDAVFHYQTKHLEVCQKNTPLRGLISTLFPGGGGGGGGTLGVSGRGFAAGTLELLTYTRAPDQS